MWFYTSMHTQKNPRDDSGQKIIDPVVVTANTTSYLQPEFLRLPRNGQRDAVASLSRSGLNDLILPKAENNFKPPVKSVVLRKPGAIRGTRLIVAQSLRDYLYSNLANQEGA
jgi:hypothetical protein